MVASAASFWNRAAAKYAKRPVSNEAAFEAKKAVIKSRLGPHDTLLEIGCGTGTVAVELAAHARKVVAVDISEQMIEIARQRAAEAGVTNVTFEVRSVEDLAEFEPRSFDMVCALNLLHLVEDRPALLRRCFELLRPGGRFAETTVLLGQSWVPYRPILAMMKRLGKAPPVWIVKASQLYAEIEAAGFTELTRPSIPAGKLVGFSVSHRPAAAATASDGSLAHSA